MSYRIEYDRGNGKYEVRHIKPANYLLFLAAACVLLFSVFHFWPEGGAVLRGMLIPGEDVVTVQAFHNMTDDLRSGADLDDALEGFCRYVIHGE